MALLLISPPQAEPVTVSELKAWLRVDSEDTSQDDVIGSLGVAARAWCETFMRRRCIAQTWRLMVDYFPGYIDTKLTGQNFSSPFVSGSNAVLVGIRYAIALPYAPVQSITRIQYIGPNGNILQMDPGTYIADLASAPARITPLFGQMWPIAQVVVNAVQVDFVCGYAAPFAISVTSGQKAVTGAAFAPGHVGQPISIPGAGLIPDGEMVARTLNTIIADVDGSGNATLRDAAATDVTGATAIANAPNAPAGIEASVRTAVRLLVTHWYEARVPDDSSIPFQVKAVLYPYRDMRL